MKIKWFVAGLVVVALIAASLVLSAQKRTAEAVGRELQEIIEYRLDLKTELFKQTVKHEKLMAELDSLVFLCDKYELDIPDDLFVNPEDGVWIFEKSDGNSRVKFQLPEGRNVKFEALKIENAPRNNFHFRSPKGEVLEFTIEGAGWHMIERSLEEKNGVTQVNLVIDSEIKSSMQVKSGRQSGFMHRGLQNKPMRLQNGKDQQNGLPVGSVWNVFFRTENEEQRVYGYDLDRFELIDRE